MVEVGWSCRKLFNCVKTLIDSAQIRHGFEQIGAEES
jgi:hypothetical protein